MYLLRIEKHTIPHLKEFKYQLPVLLFVYILECCSTQDEVLMLEYTSVTAVKKQVLSFLVFHTSSARTRHLLILPNTQLTFELREHDKNAMDILHTN